MIISLSGKARHGKDSVADVLVRNHKYVKMSLAGPLRYMCSQVFSIDESDFTDDNKKEKLFTHPVRLSEEHIGLMLSVIENDFKMSVSPESKEALVKQVGLEFKHPRHLLQLVGTDLIRDCVDKEFWLKVADQKLENLADVVVADVRYKNERDWLKSKGALMCFVQRPTLQKTDGHISENDLGNESDYQIIFNNDDTLNRFIIEVGSFFNNYLSRARY